MLSIIKWFESTRNRHCKPSRRIKKLYLCTNFYENLRKNYNNKKSKLYGNIVKEIDKPDEILTTLSSFLTQAILFSKKLEDKEMFLRHARVADVTRVLTSYFKDFDLSYCIRLMQLLKADIKALENREA